MKKILTATAVLGMGFIFATTAQADTFNIQDEWIDWNNSSAYDSGIDSDENGTPKVKSIDVTYTGTLLTEIVVNFDSDTRGDNWQWDSLFINTSYDGSNWDAWDFWVEDTAEDNSDGGTMYSINASYAYSLTDNNDYPGWIVREGNPNGIKDDAFDEKSFQPEFDDFDGLGSSLTYDFSGLTGGGLELSGGFFVAYAPWCANDVIGGGRTLDPVPEPTTMLLFGAGMAGLAGVARRKRK